MAEGAAAAAGTVAEQILPSQSAVRSCVIGNVPEMVSWIRARSANRTPVTRQWLVARYCEHSIRGASRFGPAFGMQPQADWDRQMGFPTDQPGQDWVVRKYPGLLRAATRAGQLNDDLRWFGPTPEDEDEFVSVADWLDWVCFSDQEMLRKLGRVTWSQAVAASAKWHARMARNAEESHAGDPDAVRTVLETGDGTRWVLLLTPEAKDYEGSVMGHCVGTGGYDGTVILSLRDSRNRPHVTVECSGVKERAILQIKGRGNRDVVPRYVPHVRMLTDYLKPALIKGARVGGCSFIDGSLISIDDAMKPGAVIKGDLTIDPLFSGRSLPPGVTVDGNLRLDSLDWFEGFPPGFAVTGKLIITACNALTRLDISFVSKELCVDRCGSLVRISYQPAYTSAGKKARTLLKTTFIVHRCEKLAALDAAAIPGDLNLMHLSSLQELPHGLRVGGSLSVSDCPGLLELPQRLRIGGDLSVLGCSNLVLRRGQAVTCEASVSFSRCPVLGEWPVSMNVINGSLSLGSVGLTDGLPACLNVGLDLELTSCAWLERLPGRLKVGRGIALKKLDNFQELPSKLHLSGKLDISDCPRLGRLPDKLAVGELLVTNCVLPSASSSRIHVRERLAIRNIHWLTSLPRMGKNACVELTGCSGATVLPDNLRLKKLSICGHSGPVVLPRGLQAEELRVTNVSCMTVPASCRIGSAIIQIVSIVRMLSSPRKKLFICKLQELELPREISAGSEADIEISYIQDSLKLPERMDVGALDISYCEAPLVFGKAVIREALTLRSNQRMEALPQDLVLPALVDISGCPGILPLPPGMLASPRRTWRDRLRGVFGHSATAVIHVDGERQSVSSPPPADKKCSARLERKKRQHEEALARKATTLWV